MFFLFSWFSKIGKTFVKLFKSKAAQNVLSIIIEQILPEAKPIVASIQNIINHPSQATIADIINLYTNFKQEIGYIEDNAQAKGNAVLNLAVMLLKDKLGPKYNTPLLEAAITTALASLRAELGLK
jgi:hypothetical protein